MALLKDLTVFLTIVVIVRGGVIAPVAFTAPVAKTVIETQYDSNPQYSFAYDVQDALTGDSKNHQETRNGNIVHGRYSLTDSDGTRRIVDYTAYSVNGFNAVVRKEPLVHAAAPVLAKITAPIAYTAPVLARTVPAPVAYTAPVLSKTVAAPVALTAPVVTKAVAAPVAYTAPAPVAFTAPVAAYGAHPYIAKYAATPLAYTAPLAYSAPVVAKLSAPLVTKVAHF